MIWILSLTVICLHPCNEELGCNVKLEGIDATTQEPCHPADNVIGEP